MLFTSFFSKKLNRVVKFVDFYDIINKQDKFFNKFGQEFLCSDCKKAKLIYISHADKKDRSAHLATKKGENHGFKCDFIIPYCTRRDIKGIIDSGICEATVIRLLNNMYRETEDQRNENNTLIHGDNVIHNNVLRRSNNQRRILKRNIKTIMSAEDDCYYFYGTGYLELYSTGIKVTYNKEKKLFVFIEYVNKKDYINIPKIDENKMYNIIAFGRPVENYSALNKKIKLVDDNCVKFRIT